MKDRGIAAFGQSQFQPFSLKRKSNSHLLQQVEGVLVARKGLHEKHGASDVFAEEVTVGVWGEVEVNEELLVNFGVEGVERREKERTE